MIPVEATQVTCKGLCSSLAATATLCVLLGTNAGANPPGVIRAEDTRAPSPREILQQAFDNYYGCDTRAEVELLIHNSSGAERRRVLDTAAKRIDGRRRGLARVTFPIYLRGMTFLTLENEDRSHDAFIYLPSQQRVRRVSAAQRTDAFLGSDLTHEDIQRRRIEDYDVELLPPEKVAGEVAHVVLARPRTGTTYDHLVILVAAQDSALLEVRYFRGAGKSPYRTIRMPRPFMHMEDGHVLPTRIDVENAGLGTTTQVRFRSLVVNPKLEDRIFEPSWLERHRPLSRNGTR